MLYSYFAGQYTPTDQVSIPAVSDIMGLVRGYRIFTACRTVQKSGIFQEAAHIERLFRGAEEVGMQLPHSRAELQKILQKILAKNKNGPEKELLFEIVYTGGPVAANGVAPAGAAELLVLVFEMKLPPEHWYTKGVYLATYPYQRSHATVKTMFYLGGVIAHQTVVKDLGADEALFLDPADKETVLEGTTFNIFLIDKDGQIFTPPLEDKILAGITRQSVLEMPFDQKIYEKKFTLSDLREASEAFMCSSTRDIVPVTKIDDFVIGEGAPGPVTAKVAEAFATYQQSFVPKN